MVDFIVFVLGMFAGGIRNLIKKIGTRAGVDNTHPHRFRRTFATNLYKHGMDLHEIQRLMGHSDVKTTLSIFTLMTTR